MLYLQRVLELVPEGDVARDIARSLEAHVVRCAQTLLRNARKACIDTTTEVNTVVLIHKVSTYTELKALEEMTELERLQAENEYLRAENAILKKLRELRLKEEKEKEERQKLFKN